MASGSPVLRDLGCRGDSAGHNFCGRVAAPPPIFRFRCCAATACATASATSARGSSDRRSTNSSGLWACPPRGPSPSIVTGIVAAKWLASLAPPRAPRRPGGRAPRRRARAPAPSPRGVHPRPLALHLRARSARRRPRRGSRPSTAAQRLEVVGAHVADQLAAAGDDVERVAGAHDRRDGGQPVGAVRGRGSAATSWATSASASSALTPRSGAEPECAARPCARTRMLPAALRRTTTASSPVRVALAGLEAQARVAAREARRRGRTARSATPRR